MAFGFYYFSLPKPYVYLLELAGLVKYALYVSSRHLGLYTPSDPPVALRPPPREALPVVGFETFLERRGLREDGSCHLCAICMCPLEVSHEVRELANCGHAFHKMCLDAWVDGGRSTCPLCRLNLFSESSSTDLW